MQLVGEMRAIEQSGQLIDVGMARAQPLGVVALGHDAQRPLGAQGTAIGTAKPAPGVLDPHGAGASELARLQQAVNELVGDAVPIVLAVGFYDRLVAGDDAFRREPVSEGDARREIDRAQGAERPFEIALPDDPIRDEVPDVEELADRIEDGLRLEGQHGLWGLGRCQGHAHGWRKDKLVVAPKRGAVKGRVTRGHESSFNGRRATPSTLGPARK